MRSTCAPLELSYRTHACMQATSRSQLCNLSFPSQARHGLFCAVDWKLSGRRTLHYVVHGLTPVICTYSGAAVAFRSGMRSGDHLLVPSAMSFTSLAPRILFDTTPSPRNALRCAFVLADISTLLTHSSIFTHCHVFVFLSWRLHQLGPSCLAMFRAHLLD